MIIIIGGVGRMPSSQATHDGRNSPTVMNSTTLLGTLPSEVIVIVKTDHHFTLSTLSSCFAFMITTMFFFHFFLLANYHNVDQIFR